MVRETQRVCLRLRFFEFLLLFVELLVVSFELPLFVTFSDLLDKFVVHHPSRYVLKILVLPSFFSARRMVFVEDLNVHVLFFDFVKFAREHRRLQRGANDGQSWALVSLSQQAVHFVQ
jgi:hypothetical protein